MPDAEQDPAGPPVAEDHRRQADVAATVGLVGVEAAARTTRARKPPPRPARPPETSTAMYLYSRTLTPRDSAAYGFSPQERSRRPKRVRQSTKPVTATRTKHQHRHDRHAGGHRARRTRPRRRRGTSACRRAPRTSRENPGIGDREGLLQAGELLGAAVAVLGVQVGEERLGQERGQAERDHVERDTGDDVVDAEGDRGEGVDEAAEHAEQHGAEQADVRARSSR